MTYRDPILRQKCSCGATVELSGTGWAPNSAVLEWWDTHPCPNRKTISSPSKQPHPYHDGPRVTN